jgi:hypothetical protein
MPTQYKTIIGPAMTSMLPKSVVGVRIAAHTTQPSIACLKGLTSIVAVTSVAPAFAGCWICAGELYELASTARRNWGVAFGVATPSSTMEQTGRRSGRVFRRRPPISDLPGPWFCSPRNNQSRHVYACDAGS